MSALPAGDDEADEHVLASGVVLELRATDAHVRGGPRAFRLLAERLDAAAMLGASREARPAGVEAPEVDRFAVTGGAIEIEPGSDPVRVRGEPDGALRLIGGTHLLHLGAWLRALADRPGRRVRLAWHAGHPYIAESSLVLDLDSRGEPSDTPGESVSEEGERRGA